MVNYKELYIKYKNKYNEKKKNNINEIKGGRPELTDEMIENLYKISMEKLEKLKEKYQPIFKKGLEKKKLFEMLEEIEEMGVEIEDKYKFDFSAQTEFLRQKMSIDNRDRTLNNILMSSVINEYVSKILGDSTEKMVEYLKKGGIPLKNNKICEYSTGNLIGEGSFGAVYKLEGNKVMKVINVSNYSIPKMGEYSYLSLKSIVNEISIMKKLNRIKPQISPKIYDYWLTDSKNSLQVYIVMDFKGISLLKWKENGNTLTKEDEERIEKKINKMHELEIVHTDLHDENILVDTDENGYDFYIADFGLSKTKKDLFEIAKSGDLIGWRIYIGKYFLIKEFLDTAVDLLDIELIKM